MDAVTLLLIVLLIVFLVGGVGWPRPAEGVAVVNTVLYVIVVVIVVVLIVRLLGVAL